MATLTHHVPPRRLHELRDRVRRGALSLLVIGAHEDALIRTSQVHVLAEELEAVLLMLHATGHGANEQRPLQVNGALEANIRRGLQQHPATGADREPREAESQAARGAGGRLRSRM